VRTLAKHLDLGADEPAVVRERLLANRGALEATFRAFCDEIGVPCLSATPLFDALAREGELAYLVTDTHWQPDGQEALLRPLIDLLREQGVLERDAGG